jgi:hypothetical protein
LTLKEVAESLRAELKAREKKDVQDPEALEILEVFESDPDFSLRERLEALADNLAEDEDTSNGYCKCRDCQPLRPSNRVRELLKGGGT